ncbi:MAG: DUF4386 family protein [Bacteroidales bacterium]|nr:DUF4386 family protein [Bacteroidales bacterium]
MNQSSVNNEKQWKNIYTIGAIATIIVILGILLDIFVGSSMGGDLTTIPKTAADRFNQFNQNAWLGLYNLDLLNITNQLFFIPGYFALYAAHRKVNNPFALLTLIVFLTGTILFIVHNTALPMLELSKKYAAAVSEQEKTLFAAAGEALLARGEHGSAGVFIGFLLPNIAGMMMAVLMYSANIFNKATAITGFLGSLLLSLYIILVTFVPGIEKIAILVAMPGGLLSLTWMILFTIRLFKMGRSKNIGD